MRIKTLGLKSFGPIKDLELTDVDRQPVVIWAKNEGGKSTLKNALETLLFGFSPASRDKHPYTCWQGGDMELWADIILDDGTEINVHRKLLSTSRGVVTGPGIDREDLRNRPLAMVEYISRDMFKGVYSLALEDMQLFKGQTWDGVQDRLLCNLGAEFLKAPRTVIEQLNAEATMLWRTDNRGNPKAKVLKAKIRDLKRQRLEAHERYRRIRQLDDQRLSIRKQIDDIKEEITRLRAMLRKANRLNPVRKMLKRQQELLAGIGDVNLLSSIPDNAGDILRLLDQQLAEARDRQLQIESRIKVLQDDVIQLGEEDKFLLDKKQRIKSAVNMVGLFASDRERMAQLSRQLDIIDGRLKEAAEDVLEQGWHDGLQAKFEGVSRAELRGRITAYKDAKVRYDEAVRAGEAQIVMAEGMDKVQALPKASLVLLLLSGGVLAVGYLISLDLLKLLAGIGLAFSAAQLWSWYRAGRDRRVNEQRIRKLKENAEKQLQAASIQLERRRREVLDLIKDIPVVSSLKDNPDEMLYTGVVSIQQLLEKKADLLRDYQDVDHRYHERIRQVEELSGQSMDGRASMAEQVILELAERLRVLEDSIKISQGVSREITDLKEQLKGVTDEIEAIKKRREGLYEPLRILGGGDLDKGLENAQRQKRDYQQYQKIQEDLEREYPDLEDIMKEIEHTPSEDGWIFSDEQIIRMEDRVDELADELGELKSREAELNNEIANLSGGQTLDEIDGLLEVLRQQLDRVQRKRDRLELLKNIIITSERQFREQHQPDVLKKASEYLALITGGRYTALFFEEQHTEPRLMVKVLGDPYPIPASHPLSRGTLDQIYLSLRLSLMDHLDEGFERLPLFMDEVFVNWDQNRLNNGLDVLDRVLAKRQVFVFTCHKWLAETLKKRFDIPIVNLSS